MFSAGQEELGFILPTSASSRKPYVRLRLLVTLRSSLPRRKGAKKIIQVVPSLWGLQTRGTALSFAPSKTICCSRRTRKTSAALHRTKKIDLYFRGVTALRSPRLLKLFNAIMKCFYTMIVH